MFDDDYDDFDITEPFSEAEFVVHNDRELRNLDAGRNEWDNGDDDRVECPHCGNMVKIREDDAYVHCRECGEEFEVD
jgi:ribosomal protein S26